MADITTCRITVVTALYNSVEFLGRLHDSLSRQTNNDFEWVLVDDGSSDGSADFALTLSAPWRGGTRVFRMPSNTGGPLAYALGILNATGEIVTTVDHDDEVVPNLFETVLEFWPLVKSDVNSAGLIFQVMDPVSQKVIGRQLPEGLVTTFCKLQAFYPDVTDVAGFFRTSVAKCFMSLAKMEMIALGGVPMRAMSGPYTVLHPKNVSSRLYNRDNSDSQTLSVRISDKFVYTYAKLIESMDIYAIRQPILWVRRAVAASRIAMIIHKNPAYHLRYISGLPKSVFAMLLIPMGVLTFFTNRRKDRIVTFDKINLTSLSSLPPHGITPYKNAELSDSSRR